MGSTIYCAVLLITLSSMGRCQQPITCDAGGFKAGQTASVTCSFHVHLEDIRHHVYVEHYPLEAPDDSLGNEIVRCFRSNDQKLICEAAKGVQIHSNITDRLTFYIPEVTTDFAGRYMCQLVPPDDTVMVSCSLTVEGTFTQNKTENTTKPEYLRWLKLDTIAVPCLLGSILFGISCFCCFRWLRCFNRKESAQFNGMKRIDPDLQRLAKSSGRSVCNKYTEMTPKTHFNKQNLKVSGQPDLFSCEDVSIDSITHRHRSPCRAATYSDAESQNNQIEIHTGVRFLTVRSHSPSSISCIRENDSSSGSTHSFSHIDDFHSGNETDGSCSFHSSRQTTGED